MRLKRLTISGFKSFPKRVSITFSQGVSAIVGPNGSGKSNIVDAVRWVLGEQNPRLLRAKSMDDLIYRGNGTKAPRSAYVRLILENSRGMAPPELASIPEIEIERILFPSGEAKFRLNRKNCRLKDIRYLFMDTGAGARAYSIIDQGQVGHFVSMSSEQRRMMVEEVAGISRYKARRAEASGRLRQTLQNLERLNDIIIEVKKQAAYLKRQAARANRYLKLRERQEALSLFILKSRWAAACQQEKELAAVRSYRIRKKEALEMKLLAADTRLKEMDLLMEENRQQVKTLKDEIGQIEADIEGLSLRLMDREKELVLCRQTTKGLKEKFEDIDAHRKNYLERLKALEKKLKILEERAEAGEGDRQSLLDMIGEVEKKVSGRLRSLETAREALVDLSSERAGLNSRKASLQESIKGLKNRFSRLNSQFEDARKEIQRLKGEREGIEERAVEAGAAMGLEEGRLRDLKKRLSGLDAHLSRLSQRAAEQSSRVTRLRAELDTLSSIMSARMQPLDGARELLRGLGMEACALSDILQVERGWEEMVETALGETVHAFFLKDCSHKEILKAVQTIIAKAKENQGLSLLPSVSLPEGRDEKGTSFQAAGDDRNGVSCLSERIQGNDQATEICRVILSRWFFAEDIESALRFKDSKRVSGPFHIITRDGFVITPWNEIRFSGSGGKAKGLLWTRARCGQISRRLARAENALLKLENKSGALEEKRQGLLKEISQLEQRLLSLRQEKDELEAEKQRIDMASNRTRDKIELYEFEQEEIDREQLHLKGALSEVEEKLSGVTKKEEQASMRLQELERAYNSADGQMKELRSRLQNYSLEKTRIETEKKGLQKEISRILEEIERSESLSRDIEKEVSVLSKREKGIIRQIEEHSRKKQILVDEETSLLKTLKEREDSLEELLSRRTHQEGVKRELSADHSALSQELHEVDIQLSKLLKEKEYLSEACRSGLRRQIDADDFDFPRDILGLSPEEADESLALVRQKIERIGPVNLTAIEEFEELEGRLSFLREQEADLRASADDIQKAIERIDMQCRQKFKQALDDINASLERVFPLLFDGGHARLGLESPGNLLESGVELLIDIPGKRIRNLNLLSGGEKALSALALIFSIFFIKPSPFCLLDEVDAPLDEANTARFNRLIRKISQNSQVILVTHNQSVMETADTLYGVTMEEKGISKLISVSLV